MRRLGFIWAAFVFMSLAFVVVAQRDKQNLRIEHAKTEALLRITVEKYEAAVTVNDACTKAVEKSKFYLQRQKELMRGSEKPFAANIEGE